MANKHTQGKKEITPTVSGRDVKLIDIYNEFILWTAVPSAEKEKLGIESQADFCAFHKISVNTPTAWKQRKDYQDRVTELRRQWAFDRTSNVVQGIYLSAIKGNPHSQKLWLQYFLNFTEKAEVTHKEEQTIGVGDIRHLIEQLPEPLRSKHYANLRELLDDATSVANALNAEERATWDKEPPGAIPGEADNDAQDLPGPSAHVLARGNTQCVRADMVGEAHPHNHQGAERWW